MGAISNFASAGLISYWPLDDNAANTTLTNAVNSNYNAALKTTTNGDQNTNLQSVSGKIGTAINFANAYYGPVNNGVDFCNSFTGSWTLSAWEYDHTTAGGKVVFAFGNNGGTGVNDQRFQVELGNQAVQSWHFLNPSGSYYAPGSFTWGSAGFVAGTWHHIVYVYNSDRYQHPDAVSVYKDGVLLPVTDHWYKTDWYQYNRRWYSPSEFADASKAAAIGGIVKVGGANQLFDKRLDDVALWDTTLSGTQIKALYNLANSGLNYGAGNADALFTAFAAQTGTSVGGKTWYYWPSGIGGNDGEVLDLGGGDWTVNLGGGAGMSTIPEPSTLALLACGLLGLLCYAWRKRK